MKKFIKMKYEQYLMRKFDRILKQISKTDVNWYPKFVLCGSLEDKVHKLEIRNSKLEFRIQTLEEELELNDHED